MNADEKVTAPLPAAASDERATVPLPGPDASTAPLHPKPDTLGRFVVRGKLGSGAFGDVYRAYDPTLDREVAVKVARPGTLDTPERLARFLREAKAAANLRHPHIVPLYETGTDADRRFIVSAFIDGQTLEAVILDRFPSPSAVSPTRERGTPAAVRGTAQPIALPLAQVADIGRKLADALAYAHAQGVVHRDVKPANVLVDAAGEPHLLDFGLAAREEDGAERLTQDGQGMGTPAYMAPEQAAGKGEAASDQYSLGCALYELATGQTPFAGGTAQQMFLHRTEPVPPPRKLRPDIPKDLDTLLLKCLEKDPARRYAGCADLADDLRRFAAGEPVQVRRAGPVERLTRWAKRNKRLAGMGALVLLTMAIGTGISLGFGLYANELAEIARGETQKANDATEGEKKEKQNAVDAAGREKKEKENAQRSLAKSLLGPISPTPGEFSDYERNAVWELASLREGPVPLILLEEATGSEIAAAQFLSRVNYLDHAAVGLDSRKRREADGLFDRRLGEAFIDADLKGRVALAAISAERFDSAETIADVLLTALTRATGKNERRVLAEGLAAVAPWLTPDKAAEVCGEAADLMTAALAQATNSDMRRALADGLVAVALRLTPDKSADMLLVTLGKATDLFERRALATGLATVALRLPPDRPAEVLPRSLGMATDSVDRQVLMEVIAAVAVRLPAGNGAELLLVTLGKSTDSGERLQWAEVLATVALRLPPDKAAAVCERAAEALLVALRTANGEFQRRRLAEVLATVALRLPPDKAAAVCERAAEALLVALRKESVGFGWEDLAAGLAAVCGRLPEDKAAVVCGEAADLLTSILEKATSGYQRQVLSAGLGAVVSHLPADKAAAVCERAVETLQVALGKATSSDERKGLAKGLAAVAPQLPPDRAAEALLVALGKATGGGELERFVAGLAGVAGRLPPDKAAEVCGRAADVLTGALEKATYRDMRGALAAGLAAVAERLPADKAADVLLAALAKAAWVEELRALAAGVLAVAGRLPADKAAEACGKTVDVLTATLGKATAGDDRQALAETLAAVVTHLPLERAATVLERVAEVPLATLGKATDINERLSLGKLLAAVAERLPPDKGVEMLLAVLGKMTMWDGSERLAVALAGVAGRLPPDKAAEVCGRAADVLTAALEKATDINERGALAAGLAAVAGRLPADKAADVLLAALAKAAWVEELRALAAGVLAVAGRLPADKAAEVRGRVAEALLATPKTATGKLDQWELAKRRALTDARAMVASGISLGNLTHRDSPEPFAALTGVVTIHPAVLPKPHPLPPQQLVELLKHPFCVKDARRAVLDALEFTYDRKFADLWEFVAFAEKEHPELDLLTPPKRPEKVTPKAEAK